MTPRTIGAIASIALWCTCAFGQEFALEGVLSVVPQRYSIKPYSLRMEVAYKHPNWAIRQIWETDGTNRLVTELRDDGTNLYKLDHWEPMTKKYSSGDYSEAYPRGWTAELHRSGFPSYVNVFEPFIIYYAYASAPYLDSVTNSLLIPMKFSPEYWEQGDRPVKALITRSGESLNLPKSICFFSYEGDKTNAVMISESFTNVGKVRIPNVVHVTRYASDGKVLCLFRFDVSKVRSECGIPSFRPIIPASQAVISDFRFSHGHAYVPPVTSFTNDWPDELQSKSHPSYKATQLDWEKMPEKRAGKVCRHFRLTKRLLHSRGRRLRATARFLVR
jgi:hypothetical protein